MSFEKLWCLLTLEVCLGEVCEERHGGFDREAGRNDGILTCWPATKDTMDEKDRNAVKEREN